MNTDMERFDNELSRIQYNVVNLLEKDTAIDEKYLSDELHYFLEIGLGKVIR